MEYMDAGSLDTLIGHPDLHDTAGGGEEVVEVQVPQSDFDTATRLPGGPKVGGIPELVLARITGAMVRGLKLLKDELNVIHRGRDIGLIPSRPAIRPAAPHGVHGLTRTS